MCIALRCKEVTMETGDEQRPTGETAFGGQTGDELSWQTTDAIAPIHTDRNASAVNSATPKRITPFTDDIRPQPGSIVFLPVPVAFFFHYGNQAGSLLLFACTQLVTSVALLLIWVVARVDHLLDPATPSEYLTLVPQICALLSKVMG
jgi:hypothetical protein